MNGRHKRFYKGKIIPLMRVARRLGFVRWELVLIHGVTHFQWARPDSDPVECWASPLPYAAKDMREVRAIIGDRT